MPLLFALAVAGAVLDWRFIQQGGKKPTAQERRGLYSAIGVTLILVLGLLTAGASAAAIGDVTGILVCVIFACWEFHRWRVRTHARSAPR